MNTKIINITVRSIIIIISAISIVLTIGMLLNFADLKIDSKATTIWLDPFIILTYVSAGIATFFALAFPLSSLIVNPKKGLIALGVVAAFGILFAISYYFSTGETDAPYYKAFNIDYTWSRLIGASIFLTYLMGGLAVLSLLGTWIIKFFKN